MEIKLNFSSSEITEFLQGKGYIIDMVACLKYDEIEASTHIEFETIAYKCDEENPANLGIREDILVSKYGIKSQFEKEIKLKLLN